jgi:hypothetical protein
VGGLEEVVGYSIARKVETRKYVRIVIIGHSKCERIRERSHLRRAGNEVVMTDCKGKMNLFLCLINYALRHEDVWGSGWIAPPFLTSELD